MFTKLFNQTSADMHADVIHHTDLKNNTTPPCAEGKPGYPRWRKFNCPQKCIYTGLSGENEDNWSERNAIS